MGSTKITSQEAVKKKFFVLAHKGWYMAAYKSPKWQESTAYISGIYIYLFIASRGSIIIYLAKWNNIAPT